MTYHFPAQRVSEGDGFTLCVRSGVWVPIALRKSEDPDAVVLPGYVVSPEADAYPLWARRSWPARQNCTMPYATANHDRLLRI